MKISLPGIVLVLLVSLSAKAQPNFSENIAQIFYDHCTACHRPGNIGPFPLLTYDDAVNNAYSIQSAVTSGIMPPWPPDPEYRHFKGELVLSEIQISLINDWVNNGTPQGNPNLAPPQPTFPSGSQLGTPDLVLTMQQAHYTQGNDSDEYYFFVLPTNLASDKFIKGIEFIPGNSAAVHHGIFYVDTTGSAQYIDDTTAGYGFRGAGTFPIFPVAEDLGGWAPPGLNQSLFPEGLGRILWKNSDIVIGLHYAPSDSIYADQSTINVFFSDNDSMRLIQNDAVWEFYLTAPPLKIFANTVKTFEEIYPINEDISLYTIAPHAHLLCKHVLAYAVTSDGDTIHLVDCDWNFHWQYQYTMQLLQKIPAGSQFHVLATYDNTTNNPDNPNNPPITVSRGESTKDEMMLFYYNYIPYLPGDENFIIDSSLLATGNNPAISDLAKRYPVIPNPAKDHFVTFVSSEELPLATLFDLSGKQMPVVFQITKQNDLWRVYAPTSGLADGMYFLKIDAGEMRMDEKVIVVR